MERLWLAPETLVTVREVHAALAAERDLAYTTVMTVLDRLERKGMVVRERDGRAYRYRPRGSRAAMTAEILHETLADFTGHDRATALVAFVEGASAEDAVALREALAALED